MVSATKIAERLPDVGSIPIPDIQLPDLPDVGELTDRVRGLTEAAATSAQVVAKKAGKSAGRTARQAQKAAQKAAEQAAAQARQAAPSGGSGATPLLALGLVGVLVAVFLVMRSRRSRGSANSSATQEAFART